MPLHYRSKILLDLSAKAGDAIRRTVLVERETELQHGLANAFLLGEYGQKALNTQLAVLEDLSFFLEWQILLSRRADSKRSGRSFVPPECRVLSGLPALTDREVKDFCLWACVPATRLAIATWEESPKLVSIPAGNAVKFSTSNRRIKTAGAYVAWLTKNCDPRLDDLSAHDHRMLDASASKMQETFNKRIAAGDDSVQMRSLNDGEMEKLEQILRAGAPFDLDTPTGRRDRLIAETLKDSGLRAGELLKLYCVDVVENFEYEVGNFTSYLRVIKSQNDRADTRIHEPAAKTQPGIPTIPRTLAMKLIEYIVGDREQSLSETGLTTPFLFVNHVGKFKGQPLGQRNLNRIVAKLKSVDGLPSTIAPHVLRHTNLNRVFDRASSKGVDARAILIARGRWSENSSMPNRYAQRAIAKQAAALEEERDQKIS